MSLPIRATRDDITAFSSYLTTKPTGATTAEAKAVLDSGRLDGRKVAALKTWGILDESSDRLRLTERGRLAAKDKGAHLSKVLLQVIKEIGPYAAIVERAAHRGEYTTSASDVAAHWHDHFKAEVSSADAILNDQALCFFQVAEGADLGKLTVGRKGSPTRFEFDADAVARFIEGSDDEHHAEVNGTNSAAVNGASSTHGLEAKEAGAQPASLSPAAAPVKNNRVFITHGKNKKILEQVKEIVSYGKFEAVVEMEHESTSKPVPDKVMAGMRSCAAAVIHVGSEGTLHDKDGNEVPQINGNVLIEIGAAMALYAGNFILLVEDGVKLPSNLQGLYEVRYQGNELSASATMKLLRAFNDFK